MRQTANLQLTHERQLLARLRREHGVPADDFAQAAGRAVVIMRKTGETFDELCVRLRISGPDRQGMLDHGKRFGPEGELVGLTAIEQLQVEVRRLAALLTTCIEDIAALATRLDAAEVKLAVLYPDPAEDDI